MSIKLLNFLESKLAPSTIALEVQSLAFGSITSSMFYGYSKFHVCDFLIVHRFTALQNKANLSLYLGGCSCCASFLVFSSQCFW